MGHIVDAVLVDLRLVRLGNQRIKKNPDLALPGCANLVVMHLHAKTHVLHRKAHARAHVLQRIDGRDRKVSALHTRTVPSVAVLIVLFRTPGRLGRLDLVGRPRHLVRPANRIKNKKFRLRAEVSGIARAGGLEIRFSPLGDGPRIPIVALHGRRFDHIATKEHGGVLHEGIENHRIGIRHENHV